MLAASVGPTAPGAAAHLAGAPAMLILGLIVLNLPVYVLLAWVLFDNKDRAAQSFGETLLFLLKQNSESRRERMLRDDDDDDDAVGSGSVLKVGVWFGACILVVAGEWWLITRWIWPAAVEW